MVPTYSHCSTLFVYIQPALVIWVFCLKQLGITGQYKHFLNHPKETPTKSDSCPKVAAPFGS